VAKMKSKWAKLKGESRGMRYGLRCTKCDNRMLLVIEEPVARQNRTRTAHHRRVIARCPICKGDYPLKLGPAN
jgi:uncharacterized protein with PIN domain